MSRRATRGSKARAWGALPVPVEDMRNRDPERSVHLVVVVSPHAASPLRFLVEDGLATSTRARRAGW